MKSGKDKLIVALDVDGLKKAKNLVDKLYPAVKFFKIGSQLFSTAGPDAIKMVTAKGAKVFVDLKFHDIPNTVAGAIKAVSSPGVFMVNIHASGGGNMIRTAKKSIMSLPKNRRPYLLAVTILTSLSNKDLKNLGIARPLKRQVVYMAKMAKSCGADGVVCSAKEITSIRQACGKNFIIVTPGIRPKGASQEDQRRIATPKQAIEKGADFIVVGRPITKANNPLLAAKRIIDEL